MTKKPSGPGEFVTEAYNIEHRADMESFYQKWATDYDRQMLDELGYASPRLITEYFSSYFQNHAGSILDIGCGTGLCGYYLSQSGYRNIAGIDLSVEMVEVARSREIYNALFVGNLNDPLELSDNQFSAAICAGTFTHGHVGPECLEEVFRVIDNEGVLACTVHFELWQDHGFEEKFNRMIAEGKIQELMRTADKYYDEGEAEGWFCVYRKMSPAT